MKILLEELAEGLHALKQVVAYNFGVLGEFRERVGLGYPEGFVDDSFEFELFACWLVHG